MDLEEEDSTPYFDLLSDELKEKIFLELSPNDLLNLTLTCKTFNNFIEDNSKLMDKFIMNVDKLISSDIVSLRKYSHVLVSGLILKDEIEIVKENFINIAESVKVVTFFNPQNLSHVNFFAEDFVFLCKNFETINVIDLKTTRKDLQTHFGVKTLDIYDQNTSHVPSFDEVEEINFLKGLRSTPARINFMDMIQLKRINIFEEFSAPTSCLNFLNVPNLQKVTFMGVKFDWLVPMLVSDAKDFNLKVLKFVDCKFHFASDFLGSTCKIDQLHIENCDKIPWKPENGEKVKHLKLVNLKFPDSSVIENLRMKVQYISKFDVKFCEICSPIRKLPLNPEIIRENGIYGNLMFKNDFKCEFKGKFVHFKEMCRFNAIFSAFHSLFNFTQLCETFHELKDKFPFFKFLIEIDQSFDIEKPIVGLDEHHKKFIKFIDDTFPGIIESKIVGNVCDMSGEILPLLDEIFKNSSKIDEKNKFCVARKETKCECGKVFEAIEWNLPRINFPLTESDGFEIFKNINGKCENCQRENFNFTLPEDFLMIIPTNDSKIDLNKISSEIIFDNFRYDLKVVVVNKNCNHFNTFFKINEKDFLKMDDLKFEEFGEKVGEEIFCKNGIEFRDSNKVLAVLLIYVKNCGPQSRCEWQNVSLRKDEKEFEDFCFEDDDFDLNYSEESSDDE